MPGTALGTKETARQNILPLCAPFSIIVVVAMVIIILQKHKLEFQCRHILSPSQQVPTWERGSRVAVHSLASQDSSFP